MHVQLYSNKQTVTNILVLCAVLKLSSLGETKGLSRGNDGLLIMYQKELKEQLKKDSRFHIQDIFKNAVTSAQLKAQLWSME